MKYFSVKMTASRPKERAAKNCLTQHENSVVCIVYALTKFRAPPPQLYSAAYVTIQPRTIFSYLLALFGTVSLILLVSAFALRMLH